MSNHGLVTSWTRDYCNDLAHRVEPGDLVELDLDNCRYNHFVVYVGKGNLIHNSDSAKTVVKQYYKSVKFYDRCRARINNGLDAHDGDFHPYSGTEIVQRAESMIGNGVFHLHTNNCEHFANWCRYGVMHSQSVEEARRRGDKPSDHNGTKGGKKGKKGK